MWHCDYQDEYIANVDSKLKWNLRILSRIVSSSLQMLLVNMI